MSDPRTNPGFLLVTGGRSYADEDLVFIVLDRLHKECPIMLLIHGACGWNADDPATQTMEQMTGADAHAHAWALDREIPVKACPAHWMALGFGAGPARNRYMLDRYKPERVVAFPGDKGTQNCVNEARKRGIVVEHAAREAKDAAAALVDDVRRNRHVER